jgi:hypothetical protein
LQQAKQFGKLVSYNIGEIFMSNSTNPKGSSQLGHQKKSAATRKEKNPEAFREMGRKGALARHAKTRQEESDIARRAAETRKERNPLAFSDMGREGGKAPHKSRGRGSHNNGYSNNARLSPNRSHHEEERAEVRRSSSGNSARSTNHEDKIRVSGRSRIDDEL